MTKSLNEELTSIANTPHLERIAHELKFTKGEIKRNLQVLLNLESKQKKYQELLRSRVANIPDEFFFSETDYIEKAQLIDEIIDLILKL